jgi:hypothetical protein
MRVLFNDALNCSDYAELRTDECVLGIAGIIMTRQTRITKKTIDPRTRGMD